MNVKRWSKSTVIILTGLVLVLFLSFHKEDAAVYFPRDNSQFLAESRIVKEMAALSDRVRHNPEDVSSLVQLGILHFQKGESHYLEAMQYLEQARQMGALDKRIFYYLGLMYQEEGLYPFAVREFERFLVHEPRDMEVRLLLAKLLYQEDSYERALFHYEKLRELYPDDPAVLENLALCLLKARRPESAREILEKLAGSSGEPAVRAHFTLGELAFASGRFPEAAAHFSASVPQGPAVPGIEPAQAYERLAQSYEKLSQKDLARANWEKVLAHDPRSLSAKQALRKLSQPPSPQRLSLRSSRQARRK